jgi:hypothetical protein
MRLSLDALRRFDVPRSSVGRMSANCDDGITRRTMLGITATAPFVVPAVLEAAAGATTFEIRGDERRIAFVVQGQERWVIDCAAFTGKPRLSVIRRRNRIRVRLASAWYPGTELPADFEVEIRRVLHTYQARFAFGPLDWRAEVSFVPWLLGECAAEGSARGGTFLHFAGGGGVDLSSPVRGAFHPNWNFEFNGEAAVHVATAEFRFASDAAVFALLPASAPSLAENAAAQRALVIVERNEHQWRTSYQRVANHSWTLRDVRSPFDTLWIEAGQNGDERSHLLLLFAPDGRTSFIFAPDARLRGSDGNTAEVPLSLARLALEPGEEGMRSVLIAALPERLTFHSDHFALDLCQPGEGCPFPFQLEERGGVVKDLQCTPGLAGVSVALPEAIVQTGHVTSAASLPLTWESIRNELRSDLSRLHFGSETITCHLRSFRTSVLRPRDLLALDFEFVNLDLVVSGRGAVLRRRDSSHAPIVIVHFAPQHIAEQAFFRTQDGNPVDGHELTTPPPVGSRLSGPSRLAFTLPCAEEYPYTLQWLLDWSAWTPRLVPAAEILDGHLPKGEAPKICRPQAHETAIEAPYRLFLSPLADGVWRTHASRDGEVAELWRAQLTKKDGAEPAVRAIWSPDYVPPGKPLPGGYSMSAKCSQGEMKQANEADADRLPFRTSLDRRDRCEIVKLSSDFGRTDVKGKPWTPGAIPARAFFLSALGVWLDVHGRWDPINIDKGELKVEAWKHRAEGGRDDFTQVVYSGFLFPFGHPAVLIKETERDLRLAEKGGGPGQYAYLLQRKYIVVKEPTKIYAPGKTFQLPFEGRAIAFHSVKIESAITPDLDDPALTSIANFCDDGFWPRVGGELFKFKLAAESRPVDGAAGSFVHFELPLIFVSIDKALPSDKIKFVGADKTQRLDLDTIRDEYRNANADRISATLHGQKVTFTDETKPGETTLEVDRLIFGGDDAPLDGTDYNDLRFHNQPPFYPRILKAGVRVPSMAQFTGRNAPADVVWTKTYLDAGFAGGNPGQVFVERVGERLDLGFPGKRSGGFATPSIDVQGLSRSAGPISGSVEQFTAGVFEASEFFSDIARAKLLGVIALGELIQPLKELQNNLERIPRLMLEQARLPFDQINQAIKTVRKSVVDLVTKTRMAAEEKLGAAFAPLRKIVDTKEISDARASLKEAIDAIGPETQAAAKKGGELLEGEARLREMQTRDEIGKTILDAVQHVLPLVVIDVDRGLQTLPGFANHLREIEPQIVASAPAGVVEQVRTRFAIRPEKITGPVVQQIQMAQEAWREIAEMPLERSGVRMLAAVADISSVDEAVRDFAKVSSEIATYANELQRAVDTASQIPEQLKKRVEEVPAHFEEAKRLLAERLEAEIRNAIKEVADELDKEVKALSESTRTKLDAAADVAIKAAENQLREVIEKALPLIQEVLQLAAEVTKAAKEYAKEIEKVQTFWETERKKVTELLKPRDIVVSYNIEPKVQDAPKSKPVFKTTSETRFLIRSTVRKRIALTTDPAELLAPPTFEIDAKLQNFSIVLFPGLTFLTLKFGSLSFSSSNGSAPDIRVSGVEITFGEALKFVKALQEQLPFGRKGPGFFINAGADGIRLGYRLALPSVTVGAFNLQAITLSAAIELPFDGGPALVRFSFCDFDRPFILTMGIYGGGGFFAITTAMDRVHRLEGALEFGAATELDLGVAHGRASIMAGIYFKTEKDVSLLTGYVRASGELDVLGLVSMSVEFFMGLTRNGSNCEGVARVKVSIDMRLYTIDVELTCRRTFEGGDSGSRSMLYGPENVIQIASAVPTAAPPRRAIQGFDEIVPSNDVWDLHQNAFAW